MKPDKETRIQIAKSLKKRRGIRTTAGVKEQNPWMFSATISRHCDDFFRSRGLPTADFGPLDFTNPLPH
jgi:hypothetical protein